MGMWTRRGTKDSLIRGRCGPDCDGEGDKDGEGDRDGEEDWRLRRLEREV
jgi:hypothetical protein